MPLCETITKEDRKMRGFQSYDQWKTASPFDDDYDDGHCMYCGADLPDDTTGMSDVDDDAVSEGFCNDQCRKTFMGNGGNVSENYGKPHLTEEQTKRLKAAVTNLYDFQRDHKPQYATLKDTFLTEYMPEGDFVWDDSEAGDSNVYCCNEKDCPVQWHESLQNVEYRRVDGKLSIMVYSGDVDGNWDIDCGWDEGEDFIASGVAYAIGPDQMNDHFRGWAEYWLDAATTGNDPCNQAMRSQDNWIDFCLVAAENNIKYLRMQPPTGLKLLLMKLRRLIRRLRK